MAEYKPSRITTAVAYGIFVILITFGFIYKAGHQEAPYELYGTFLLIALGGYAGKRLLRKTSKFGGFSNGKEGSVDLPGPVVPGGDLPGN